MIIDSVFRLTPPSQQTVLLREKKIAKCKKMMGDKWLLAKQIQKKDKK